jgi:hypothetical protein
MAAQAEYNLRLWERRFESRLRCRTRYLSGPVNRSDGTAPFDDQRKPTFGHTSSPKLLFDSYFETLKSDRSWRTQVVPAGLVPV